MRKFETLGYELVVGVEIHLQLNTKTKLFSACPAAYGAPPNSMTDPLSAGHPGTLPVINQAAVEKAIRVGVALQSHIAPRSTFDRKSYFYPDLPKGYQITQYQRPILSKGTLKVERAPGDAFDIHIERAHLEEDAGKMIHPQEGAFSLVDLNRAGLPLLEIVTGPDFRNAEDVIHFLKQLRQIVIYIVASDGSLERGSMRCDANISVRKAGTQKLGTRAEIKNLNSFRSISDAIWHEADRQATLLTEGGTVIQETRLWDANLKETRAMRTKAEVNDYRYFPEPDLPELVVDSAWIEEIRASLPELPRARRDRFVQDFDLPLDDATVLTQERALADYFEAVVAASEATPKACANWIQTELLGGLNDRALDVSESPVSASALAELLDTVTRKEITGSAAKTVFADMLKTGQSAAEIIKARDLATITDDDAVTSWVEAAIQENPDEVQRFLGGKTALIGFFVGQVMKKSAGKADPKAVQSLLIQRLNEQRTSDL